MKKIPELFMYILGTLIVLGFFGLLIMLITITVPIDNKDLLNISIGSLLASFSAIVGYYWGSSKSSSDKNTTIDKVLNKENKETDIKESDK
jgi:hypothetical protein